MTKMNFVNIVVTYKHHTEKSVKVALEGEEIWVPRSTLAYRCDQQIDSLHPGVDFTLKVDEWKAKELGLI